MTTNLSLAQALVLPLERGSRSFYFRAEELGKSFPKVVVDAMATWGNANRTAKLRFPEDCDLLRFPFGSAIPIVVAARLSLSFPILVSAVRLYSFTTESYARSAQGVNVELERDLQDHWFSDGGITSNFPIHLFDTWLPLRPTFGITLYDSPVPSVLTQRETDSDTVLLPRPSGFDQARPPRLRIDGLVELPQGGFPRPHNHTATWR